MRKKCEKTQKNAKKCEKKHSKNTEKKLPGGGNPVKGGRGKFPEGDTGAGREGRK